MYKNGRLTIGNPSVLEVMRNMNAIETQFAKKARGVETMRTPELTNHETLCNPIHKRRNRVLDRRRSCASSPHKRTWRTQMCART